MPESKAIPIIDPPPVSPDHLLHFPVGPGQANDPRDVLNVQKALNAVIRAGILKSLEVPEDGKFSLMLAWAIRELAEQQAFGWADPHGVGGVTHNSGLGISITQYVIESDEPDPNHPGKTIHANSALYRWMWQVGDPLGKNKQLDPGITKEMYDLAAIMAPGGVSRTIRRPGGKTEVVPGGIQQYLVPVLRELRARDLDDRDMLLMVLATIAVEAGNFKPQREGKSQYNTSNFKTDKEGKPFDLYDKRSDLGNTGNPDGYTYRGGGLVQTTGRAGYKKAGDEIGEDLVKNPDRTLDPDVAAKLLAQYMKDRESRIREDLRSATPGEMTGAERTKVERLERTPDKLTKDQKNWIARLKATYKQNAELLAKYAYLKGSSDDLTKINLPDMRRVVNGGGRANHEEEFIDAFLRGRDWFRRWDEMDIVARVVSTWPACGLLDLCIGPQQTPGTRGYRPAFDNSFSNLPPSTGSR